MNIDEFVKRVEESWPVAYAEYKGNVIEPLFDHLQLTALLSVKLFEERIKVIESRTGIKGLVEAMYTAGLLHDLGKSSTYFLESFKKGAKVDFKKEGNAKVSFMRHELAAGIILENSIMSSDLDDEETRRLIRIIARVITRHHAAMIDRHPARIETNDSNFAKLANSINRILQGISVDTVERLRSFKPCKQVQGDLCDKTLNEAERVVRNKNYDIRGALNSIRRLGDNEKEKESQVVLALSGFLVVADNIAAHAGRGSSDDGSSPAYIREWISELKEKLEKIDSDKIKRLLRSNS